MLTLGTAHPGMRSDLFDLVVRGARVVTSETSDFADVAIRAGKIAQLGGAPSGHRVIEARGLMVLPGGVDMHVHLTPMADLPPASPVRSEDYYSGSRAAIAGGITTVGNMIHQKIGESLAQTVEREAAMADRASAIDYLLHPVLNDPTPEVIAEIPRLLDIGCSSLKVMMSLGQFEARADAYLEAMTATGGRVLTLIHCEDGSMIRGLARQLLAQGKSTVEYYGACRPVASEVAALERAIAFAAETGAAIYVVHLSSAEALERCRRARERGIRVYVETRPIYLHFTEDILVGPTGAKYLSNPPPRQAADREALWRGLADGAIDTVCSDHAPWTLEQKLNPDLDITSFLPGVAELETLMPILWSEGVETGRISLSRFVELTSTNAARLFGLYPRKGAIQVGAEADLVIWDPEARRIVDGSSMESRAGYSVYDGLPVVGWPVYTISRGEIVLDPYGIHAPYGRGQRVAPDSPAASSAEVL